MIWRIFSKKLIPFPLAFHRKTLTNQMSNCNNQCFVEAAKKLTALTKGSRRYFHTAYWNILFRAVVCGSVANSNSNGRAISGEPSSTRYQVLMTGTTSSTVRHHRALSSYSTTTIMSRIRQSNDDDDVILPSLMQL